MSPDWLVARPIAHRGLHDRAGGVPENTRAAARAAIAGGYAIECDVQASLDGQAMVFHDEALGRLTARTEPVRTLPAAELARLAVADTDETIPTLPDFLETIAGRTPLVVEVKTAFDGDLTLVRRVAEVVRAYDGPVAVKSFDPRLVGALAALLPATPRGIVAERSQDDPAYARLPPTLRRVLAELLHLHESRPTFVSWRVDDLPGAPPYLCRLLGRMPVMTWTVRTDAQRELARAHADQMVFEGFAP